MSAAYRELDLECRVYGVAVGTVEENDDPEHEGRVKVRFPWLDDTTISEWCRVVQPYAGPSFGAVFIPEKQTEVLLAFTHGDMVEPIVIGGLYNGTDKPPKSKNVVRPDVKVLRTKGGHTLRLDDSSGSPGVEIQTNRGNEIHLDDQSRAITVKTMMGQKLALDDQGLKVELSAGAGSITIDMLGSITIRGLEIKLQAAKIDLEAINITLKAGVISLAAPQISTGG